MAFDWGWKHPTRQPRSRALLAWMEGGEGLEDFLRGWTALMKVGHDSQYLMACAMSFRGFAVGGHH